MLGVFLLMTRGACALVFTLSWLPLTAASSLAFMCGAEAISALKTAEFWGPMRMRSLKADSCSEREAAGADAKAFSSSRREMRMGNSTATSCGPAWIKQILT